MPIFWTEERISKSGARLPYTEVYVAGLTLRFNGRFGAKMKEAAQHLEAQQLDSTPTEDDEKIRGEGR